MVIAIELRIELRIVAKEELTFQSFGFQQDLLLHPSAYACPETMLDRQTGFDMLGGLWDGELDSQFLR